MRKILITGGSGFIGTNLIENLLQRENYQILSLDIVSPKIESHKEIWKLVDICNQDMLNKVIKDFCPEIVIHLAARTDLNGASLSDYDANVLGVKNLLNVLAELSSVKKVIFASSMYVCKPGYKPQDFDDYYPHTIYGESKVQTEKIIKEKDPSYIWTIIRPTSIWGPYFGEPYNLFFKMVLSRKYFHMGSKACKKTYGYIDNFIYQLITLINADKSDINKKTFYLGDYEPYDITAWADEIAQCKEIKIPNIPYFLFKIAGFFGDFLKLVGIKFPMTSFRLKNMTTDNIFDLSPLEKITGALPVSREVGTKITVDWMVNNKINNKK